MSDHVEDFIGAILQHEYDPVARREYYLRTRELKGKRKTVHEDQVPMKSPTGAKLIDFDGANGGRATYSDGSTFDGDGWNSDKKPKVDPNAPSPQARMNVIRNSIAKLKTGSNYNTMDSRTKRRFDRRARVLQMRLDRVNRRLSAANTRGA